MTKKQRILERIKEHECRLHLAVHDSDHLTAVYTYNHGDARCTFGHLTEVSAHREEEFLYLLKARGLWYTGWSSTGVFQRDLLTPNPRTPAGRRWTTLMPGMVPRWLRVYDNGGIDAGGSFDRYTAVFTGKAATCEGEHPYLAMSENPYHPQGFGQRGYSNGRMIDGPWAPLIGRKNHLGTRIKFEALPPDCQRCVIDDYLAVWNLHPPSFAPTYPDFVNLS